MNNGMKISTYKKKLIASITKEIWSLIPARSGSTRVKNKNLQKINNIELISYTIALSKKLGLVDRTFVSTNCKKISLVAKYFGAECPFLRPDRISGKNSSDSSYVLNFLQEIYKIEKRIPFLLIQLRPTTPFRSETVVSQAIKNFIKKYKNYDSLRSSNLMSHPPEKLFRIKNGIYTNLDYKKIDGEFSNKSSYLFKNSYKPNGYVDIIKVEQFLSSNELYGRKIMPCITNDIIEIDSPFDLELAKQDKSVNKLELLRSVIENEK